MENYHDKKFPAEDDAYRWACNKLREAEIAFLAARLQQVINDCGGKFNNIVMLFAFINTAF